MDKTNSRYIAQRGYQLFLIITLAVITAIVWFTVDERTWTYLAHFRYEYLLITLLLVLSSWCFDALRLKTLVAAQGGEISFFKSFEIILSSIFVSALTPFSSGGGVLQIYLLSQERVSVGNGSAISLIKLSMDLLFFLVCVPLGFLLIPSMTGSPVSPFWGWVIALPFLFALALYYLLRKPDHAKRAIGVVIVHLDRLRLIGRRGVHSALRRAFEEIDTFHNALRDHLRRRKRFLIRGLMYTVFHISLRFMVAPVLLTGLGIEARVLRAFLYQVMLALGLCFSPTPGGSGVAELGFVALFTTMVPGNLVGIYAALWRFFTSFIAVALGGLLVVKTFGLKGLKVVETARRTSQ